MLGWVITCHDDRAQEILDALEKKHGALLQCRAVNFWRGLTSNMLSRMMCHKHSRCEVISGVTLPLIEQMMACRETMTSSAFREHIVELGAPEVSSLWHQQQKNPPFVLKHNLYEY